MTYEKPTLEFWDLDEEEGVVVTSLAGGGDHGEGGGNDGDFIWPDNW